MADDARYCTSCKMVVASYEKKCPRCGMYPLATLTKGRIETAEVKRTEEKLTTFGFTEPIPAKKPKRLKAWTPQRQL